MNTKSGYTDTFLKSKYKTIGINYLNDETINRVTRNIIKICKKEGNDETAKYQAIISMIGKNQSLPLAVKDVGICELL